jgi:hypothetical protein
MAASEASVNAVMETLGCKAGTVICLLHREYLYDRGCPVAVAAADAAVDADRASIQSETLREASAEAFQVAVIGQTPQRDLEPGEAEWFWGHELAKDDAFDHPSRAASRWLCARADRIEVRP